jgi:hypothetical protein
MGSLTRAAEEDPAAAEEEWSDEAVIYVNGVRRVLPDGLAHLTLLQYLRGRSLPLCFCYFCWSTLRLGDSLDTSVFFSLFLLKPHVKIRRFA